MDGVTILNVIECGGISIDSIVGAILWGGIALIAIISGVYSLHHRDKSGIVLIVVSIIPILAFLIFVLTINEPKYNEYQVLIDESVKLVEFNEKYEIVDQDGKIYTVIEREDKE